MTLCAELETMQDLLAAERTKSLLMETFVREGDAARSAHVRSEKHVSELLMELSASQRQLLDQQSRLLECEEREVVLRNALADQSRQFALLEHDVASMSQRSWPAPSIGTQSSSVKSRASSMETVPSDTHAGHVAMFQWMTKETRHREEAEAELRLCRDEVEAYKDVVRAERSHESRVASRQASSMQESCHRCAHVGSEFASERAELAELKRELSQVRSSESPRGRVRIHGPLATELEVERLARQRLEAALESQWDAFEMQLAAEKLLKSGSQSAATGSGLDESVATHERVGSGLKGGAGSFPEPLADRQPVLQCRGRVGARHGWQSVPASPSFRIVPRTNERRVRLSQRTLDDPAGRLGLDHPVTSVCSRV